MSALTRYQITFVLITDGDEEEVLVAEAVTSLIDEAIHGDGTTCGVKIHDAMDFVAQKVQS